MLIWSSGNSLHRFLLSSRSGFSYHQTFSLVNIKLKWVKDRFLDRAVTGQKDLKAVSDLKDRIYRHNNGCLPIYKVSKRRRQLGLDIRVSSFLRRYPTIFHEFTVDSVPWFRLTEEALCLHEQEQRCQKANELSLVDRLCKLLMLTKERTLPLQTIDQLKWDIGLQDDYKQILIPHYPEKFELVKLRDERVGVKLLCWDDDLAVSELQRNAIREEEDLQNLAFPIKFTRGFGLKKKCMSWLGEWQRLPYTSPYVDASHLDSRTDVSEKRIVGVFHELLCLTIGKMTERKNVSNLRKALGLPQKFTKVFGRHPGIFYISRKCDTQTVVLKEAYNGQELIEKHPLVEIREKYINLMRIGFLNRSRGLYKKAPTEEEEEEGEEEEDCRLNCGHRSSESEYSSESASDTFSDEDSEDEWWRNFGIDDLELQTLAIRILSQTCSSSGCERNWSVFERIHTKRRNRLEHKRLNDLVYTHYNLRLKERQASRKSLTDPISLENIDLTDDWVVEAEDDDAPLLDVDEIDDWMDVADAILDEGEGGAAAGGGNEEEQGDEEDDYI